MRTRTSSIWSGAEPNLTSRGPLNACLTVAKVARNSMCSTPARKVRTVQNAAFMNDPLIVRLDQVAR